MKHVIAVLVTFLFSVPAIAASVKCEGTAATDDVVVEFLQYRGSGIQNGDSTRRRVGLTNGTAYFISDDRDTHEISFYLTDGEICGVDIGT